MNILHPVSFLIVQLQASKAPKAKDMTGPVMNTKADRDLVDAVVEATVNRTVQEKSPDRIILFKTKTCPNCKAAESVLDKSGQTYDRVFADDEESLDLVKKFDVMQAPTLVVQKDGETEKYVGVSSIVGWIKNR